MKPMMKLPKKPKIKAPCAHWPACEGCPLIGKAYPEQLEIKRARVFEAFVNQGFPKADVSRLLKATRSSPKTLGYRNKAKWILERDDSGHLKMGMYRPGTHEVLDMPQCAVHAPEINDLSQFIKERLQAYEVPCGPPDGDQPTVRYLIVRYSFREKRLLVVFVTNKHQVPGLDRVVQDVAAHAIWKTKVVSFVQNINSDSGNVLLGEANRYLKRQGELTESLGPFRVPVGPLSFLQVNSVQASYLYKRVKQLLGPGPFEGGLDLYSGVGLIAMHMADVTKRILAVEEVGPAALEAMTATRRNRINNVLQVCADALEGIHTYNSEWGAPEWVVVNPPRKGCEEAVLSALLQKFPKRFVYVSCSPTTLARDLYLLLSANPDLELKTLEPVDMFPQTEHTECLALIVNNGYKREASRRSGRGRQKRVGGTLN